MRILVRFSYSLFVIRLAYHSICIYFFTPSGNFEPIMRSRVNPDSRPSCCHLDGVSGGTSTAHRSTPHMAFRIPKTRTQLPWSAVQSSCSSSDGGPACIRGLTQTGRTCWWMLKWRCCYISPSKRCQRGCSNAASPLQSPSSRNYITMAVIYRL